MLWHKITLPLTMEIDPKVVEIGKMGWAGYEAANKPEGFAMFHATEGSEDGMDDKFIVYLTPVAMESCGKEIGEKFTLEPCEAPARDEPNMAFVFGDPRMMGQLQDSYQEKLARAQASAS